MNTKSRQEKSAPTSNNHQVEIVELQEAKAFAKILGQETAQQILSFIAKNKGATATEIANGLSLPLSTVHYNVKALSTAKVIDDSSFHYSSKGKEVSHYELSKKVVIIVPQKEATLLSQISAILPGLLVAGAIGVLGLGASVLKKVSAAKSMDGAPLMATANDMFATESVAMTRTTAELVSNQPSPLFVGVLIGAGVVLIGAILFFLIKKTIRK